MIYDDGSSTTTYDDGSTLTTDNSGAVYSYTDAAEASAMAGAYPAGNGPWWEQASMLGISRTIDAVAAGITSIKGAMAAPFAGQNGQTYSSGTSGTVAAQAAKPKLGVLLMVGAVLYLALHGGGA